ncbi:MAG: type II secretory pathway component PulC [Myxococcota bacterium]
MIRLMGIIVLVLGLTQCATTEPREAEPLQIERKPAKVDYGPLVLQRTGLQDVLSKGPGRFFERMPVTPHLVGRRFVGYRVLELYGRAKSHPDGVFVGDIVTQVNTLPVSRPSEFMKVWNSAGERGTLVVDLIRGGERREITYRIMD